jgi:hypothetical protein
MKYALIIMMLFVSGCGATQVNTEDAPKVPDSQEQSAQGLPINSDPAPKNDQDEPLFIEGEPINEFAENDPLEILFQRQVNQVDTQITGQVQTQFSKTFQGQVNGANIWLFAVPDDEGRVMLSTEKNQEIWMAEFDLNNPEQAPVWEQMVSKSELGGEGVADHWHTFAHGYHWIVFSQPTADSAYMMKIDSDLNRLELKHIVDRYPLTEDDGPLFFNSTDTAFQVTNDMFLIEEPDGVAAAFFLPGIGHKLFRMDTDLNIIETKNIGGGLLSHGNGSSAILTDDGFSVLAADTIVQQMQSGVRLLKYDFDWEFVEEIDLVNFDEQSIGMTSGAYLDDGSFVLQTRTNPESSARGETLPPPSGTTNEDGGYVTRYLFDSQFNLASIDYLYEKINAHRVHTSLIGNLLLTTWDTIGQTTIRIDEIQ